MRSGKILAAGAVALSALLYLVAIDSPGEPRRDPRLATAPAPARQPALLPSLLARAPEPAASQPAPVDVPLAGGAPPRSHVFGRIADAHDAPVADMAIWLCSVGELWADPAIYPEIPEGQSFGSTTDADGRFDFDVPLTSSSWTSLDFRPPMFLQRAGRDFGEAGGRHRDPLHAGDNDLGTLRLVEAGAIEGNVRDERGAPVPRAIIELENTNVNGYSVNWFSDDDGHYVLGGAPEGPQRVGAACDGFTADEGHEVTVQAGRISQGVDFTLRAQPGTPTAGQHDLKPPPVSSLPLVRLRLVDAVSGEPLLRCGAAVDPDDVVIGAHPEGLVEVTPRARSNGLSAAAEGHVPRWYISVDPAEPDAIQPADDGTYRVTLEPELVATGRVTQLGVGVPYAVVRVQADDLPPSAEALANDDPYDDEPEWDVEMAVGHPHSLSADEQGRFRIGALTPGHWLVQLDGPRLAPRDVHLVIGPNEMPDLGDIELKSGGSIAGRVALPAGWSAHGIVVGLDHRFHFDAGDDETRVLGDDGAFRFDFLAPGPHEIQVAAKAGIVGEGEGWSVTVEEGRVAEALLDLGARAPHRLDVVVRVNGVPAEGLALQLDDVESGTSRRFGITDARGTCSGSADAGASAQLIVLGAGVVPPLAIISLSPVPGGTTHREIDIAAGRLLVHVAPGLLQADLPLIFAFHVRPPGQEGGFSRAVEPVRRGDDLFELGPIRPGTWQLSFGPAGEPSRLIEIVAGETTEVHLGSQDG